MFVLPSLTLTDYVIYPVTLRKKIPVLLTSLQFCNLMKI